MKDISTLKQTTKKQNLRSLDVVTLSLNNFVRSAAAWGQEGAWIVYLSFSVLHFILLIFHFARFPLFFLGQYIT